MTVLTDYLDGRGNNLLRPGMVSLHAEAMQVWMKYGLKIVGADFL